MLPKSKKKKKEAITLFRNHDVLHTILEYFLIVVMLIHTPAKKYFENQKSKIKIVNHNLM